MFLVTIVLTIQLDLPSAVSLKDKRRILKSLLTRLRNNFNISVAEVGYNDRHRQALIGAAVVANSGGFGHQVISKVVSKIESESAVIITDYQMESY